MSNWTTFRLTDALEFREGPGVLAKDFHDQGVPLIRLAGLKQGAALLDGCNFLDPQLTATKWGHFRLQLGDVLLSTSASLGEVAVVDESGIGAIPYTGIIGFRPKDFRVSARFIRFLLTAPSFKAQIEAMGVGSVMKHFGPSHLKQMSVNVPDLSDQEAIADVLGALDDKIAANIRRAATSMSLAETHFRRIMDLASGEWTLGEILSLEYGKSLPTASRIPGPVDVYGSGGVTGSHIESLCPEPGVVVGRKGTAGAVHWSHRAFFPIDTTFYVETKRDAVSQFFCYFLLRTLRLDEMNNDSAVPGLNRNQAHAIKIVLPTESELHGFSQRVSNLFALSAQIQTENQTLTTTRDALLPRLMSGKLSVRDAEKVLENAGV